LAVLEKRERAVLGIPLGPTRIFNRIVSGLRTLRFKLFLSYILISVIPLFVLWGIISITIENHLREQRLSELRSWTSQTAVFLSTTNFIQNPTARPMHAVHLGRDSASFSAGIFVADDMGVIIYDSQNPDDTGRLWANANIMAALDGSPGYSIDDGDGVLIQTAMPILDDDNNIIGAVMLAHNMTEAGGLIAGINSSTMWLIAAIAATVVLLVFIISSWLLNPLRNVLAAVKNISEGHLSQRIELKSKDEIAALSAAVNDMAQKLERTESARQEFVSNVSHELKTPLSSIKVLSESLLHKDDAETEIYREFLADIDSEVDRMTKIINELLTLVRLDEIELPLNITYFDLNNLLVDVVRRIRPLAELKAITIEFVANHQLSIDGDEMKLNLAISNIVENAVKYSYEGSKIQVLLDADAKNAFITVADSGIGIDEDDHDKIFARFYRADKGRDRETGGTGLGLAITHKTILMHKGSIKLSSKPEEGSIFTIRIPR
jgi:signal transduction histidine kinase